MDTQPRTAQTHLWILLAMGLGVVCGWFNVPAINSIANVISELFIRLLQLVSLPIIFLAIISTIANLGTWEELKVLGQKVLKYTIGTTLLAGFVALGLYYLFGIGVPSVPAEAMPEAITSTQSSYIALLMKIIPNNAVSAFLENNVIGIAFMGALLGISTLRLPEAQKAPLQALFTGLFAAILRITTFIIRFIPLGIWAFMVILVHSLQDSGSDFHMLYWYTLAIVGANLVQGIIVMPLLLYWKGLSPWRTFQGMMPALSLAFFTKSSNIALPVTLSCAKERLGISERVANTSIPLCSVINMNGCAAFILITVLFVAAHHGLVFSPLETIGWVFIATIAAIGNAGVPMGCYFLTSALLISLGVPLTLLGLILPIYTFIDMLETALNVWSDSCVTAMVDKDLT